MTVVRAGMVALAIPNIVIGAWAALTPRHWYDTFPSGGSPRISPDGPFNEHLATDAGAGLVLLGVALLVVDRATPEVADDPTIEGAVA